MLIAGNKRYINANFNSEAELEAVVQDNAEYIFGPEAFYLAKSLIRTPEGFGTIPDGFVIDLGTRTWYIIEAELAVHSVWSHIAPQVAKQIIAATQPATRRMLTELVIGRIKEDPALKRYFEDAGVHDLDIHRVLSNIFDGQPIVGIPIDRVGADLKEWAQTLKSNVKLWLVRKLVEFGDERNVVYEIPEEYQPTLETSAQPGRAKKEMPFNSEVSMADLIAADLLSIGEKLQLSYKPKGGERRQYEATMLPNGSMSVLGQTFAAPSYAALLCINDAGSDRHTVNGWTSWRTSAGASLAELRTNLLTLPDSASVSSA